MTNPTKDALVKVAGPAGQSHPVFVNLRRIDVPYGEEVPLAGPYVEALENSSVQVTILRELRKGETALGADAADAAVADDRPAQKLGGDHLPQTPAVTAVVAQPAPAIEQKLGGDNLVHGAPIEDPAAAEDGRQDSAERQQAAAEGTIAPAVVLPADPAPAGGLNREPFSPDTTLDQPITKITEDMDEFDKDQLDALLKAEKKGKNRSTLIEALERKLASL